MVASIFISFPVLGPEDIYYNLENICRFYIQNFSWCTSNFKSFLKDFSIGMFPQICSEKNYQISYILILLIILHNKQFSYCLLWSCSPETDWRKEEHVCSLKWWCVWGWWRLMDVLIDLFHYLLIFLFCLEISLRRRQGTEHPMKLFILECIL